MDIEHEGYLTYYKHGPLGKKKIKRYGVLFKHSMNGLSRIELYESKEAYGKKDITKKYYNTISLDRCQKVENDAVVEGKKVEHIIMLHFPNESKQQTFAWDFAEEMTSWLNCLRTVLFGRNDSSSSGVWEVEIKASEITEKLHMRGAYVLSITSDDIDLLDKQSRKSVMRWPLHLLRKYGRDKQEFSLEAGRRCPSGPGLFCFKTDHYNAIFHEVEANIKSLAARARTGSTSSNTSLKTANSNHANRPASPRVPLVSSVYDNPMDAKPTINNPSDEYSEPLHFAAAPKPAGKTKPFSKPDKKKPTPVSIGKATPLPQAPKKPPRRSPGAVAQPISEPTYDEPNLGDGRPDISAQYSHLNIAVQPIAETEYDSISYPSNNQWPVEDGAYATTSNAPQGNPTADDLYDRVLR